MSFKDQDTRQAVYHKSGNITIIPDIDGTLGSGLPEGWVNIRDYGALPSTIGSNANDCTQAFLDAIAAVTQYSNNQRGVVYVPPAPNGEEWYVAGAINDNFGSMPHVEVNRSVSILGCAGGAASTGGARIKLGALCAGFRPVAAQGSTDGGNATGATFEGLTIYCTPLADTAIVRGWQSNHAYSLGALIRPHRFHNLYYECVKAGTSTTATPGIGDCTKYAVEGTFGGVSQPTGNRWRPGKTYMVNDKIYPNVQCGKTFKCTVGGTTVGDTRGGGESQSENTVGAGQTPNIGEPDWFTDTSDPYGSVRSVIQETNGGPRWVPDVDDPEPQWDFTAASPCLAKAFQALHDYTHGASVFGASFDRLFTATWADPTTTQASGASMPAGFATAKYPSELGYTPGDDVVVDGGITWYCTSPDGLVPDNGVVWAARVAGAYQVYAPQVLIKEPYVQDAPTTAIGFFSTATAAQFLLSDFSAIKGPGSLFGNGVGIYARGGDASGIRVDDLLLVAQEQDYWGDPADHCIDDNSFLGNHYSNISVQGCSGWALAMRGGAQSGTAKSLYFEGFGRRSPVAGVNQIGPGGTASRGAFRISSVEVNGALSTGGPIILNDGAYNIVTTSHSDQDETMYTRAYLSGGRGLCFNMDSYNYNSPGTFDDPLGIAYVYNIYLGWWTRLQGGSWPIYSLGGLHATNVGHAHMWIHRGFQLGISTTFFVFADVAEYANTFTRAGLRYKGDLYHLPALVSRGRYFQRVVLDDGGAGGITWSAGATYSVDTYVVPTEGAGTANHRAYLVTTGGIAGGSEPSWDDTLGATVIDGAVHYTVVEGADVGFMNMVEDGAVGRTIQTSSTWADSADTDARTAAAKTAVRGRRHQKQTTTGSASQVVDDGILNSAIVGTDLTLPADSVVDITATLIVKKNGSADAGSIKMSGTFYRNGSGAPVRVGTDDNNAKLSSGVSGVTAALVINGNAVEVQVSPGSGITLDWGLARIHTERTS